MGRTVEQLDDLLAKLIQGVFPKFKERLDALEQRVQALEEKKESVRATSGARPARVPTTYSTYLQVKALADAGKDVKEISNLTGVKYSTVKGYLEWTPEKIAQKAKEEQLAAEAAKATPPAPSPPEGEVVHPSQEEPPDGLDDLIGE